MMLSKSQAKFIKSLQLKKQRKKEGLFIVEGEKSVNELLKSDYNIKFIVGLPEFIQNGDFSSIDAFETNEKTLDSIGSFKSSDKVIAVVEIKNQNTVEIPKHGYSIILDDINDPGNLGTIIRLADWYGIKTVIASPETADLYNPKVISATKGSFTRVNVYYSELYSILSKVDLPIYGALMQGENIHQVQFKKSGLIVMGNEANGINPQIESLITQKITIPKFGKAESLNVAMATGIILDNVMRT